MQDGRKKIIFGKQTASCARALRNRGILKKKLSAAETESATFQNIAQRLKYHKQAVSLGAVVQARTTCFDGSENNVLLFLPVAYRGEKRRKTACCCLTAKKQKEAAGAAPLAEDEEAFGQREQLKIVWRRIDSRGQEACRHVRRDREALQDRLGARLRHLGVPFLPPERPPLRTCRRARFLHRHPTEEAAETG